LLGAGETGEICVRGPSLMQGLYKVEREATFDADGFYHTGDVGHFDADGVLYFRGRLGEMIKTGGANVTPAEVEAALAACPGVREAYVVGVPDPERGQTVVAVVVAAAGSALDPADLLARLRRDLSSYKVPRQLVLLERAELPFTDSAKIDRRRLVELLAGRIAAASRDDDHDPFETFNRAQGAGSIRDPYPMFAAMRKTSPVHKLNLRQLLGPDRPLPPGTADEIYTVMSYDAVAEVLRDGKTFSSAGYSKSMGIVMGHTILAMDAPEHTRYRGLFHKAFTRKALERWETELIRPVVSGLVDRFVGRGRAELVRELTFPFPVSVIAGMIGLAPEDHGRFHRHAVELISVGLDWERGMAASRSLHDLFAGLIAERRREPRDDLTSVLAHAELEGTRLSDADIVAFLRLLAPAGAETTYRSSSNLLFGLLRHQGQLEALRKDRSLLPQAIEEGLRWEAPLLSIIRTATRDVELAGTRIPAGGVVAVNLGAANRDDTRWDRPDEFDIFREPKPHMAFAFGPHLCLGMHLARLETTVVVNEVLDRLPDLRLDPAAEDVHITGLVFRSPLALPVAFAPA
jgi:cytochrome P450